MSEMVLKRELQLPDGLNEIIKEVLENSKSMNSCIIRANEVHSEEIKANIDNWLRNKAINCQVFIIPDEEIGPYNAVMEKNNGRVEIGLDAGMEGLRKALL
jgi:flagellar assembly protein FliH